MLKQAAGVLLVVAATVVAVSAAQAQGAGAGKRVALVIGNSAYQHVTRLTNPVNDASDIAAQLKTLKFEVLLATDLHAGNVLRATREPWLVIDPKPFIGDPAYDATQHLLNCGARLRSDPIETIRRFADLLGVDRDRLRLWMFARAAAGPRISSGA